MILTRLGNKRAIAQKIINNFPKHRTFIELFFGAGGIFFYKQQSDYNFCKVVVFGDDIDEHMEEFFSKERIEADKLKLLEITGDEKSYAYEFEEACITSIGHSFAVFEGIDLYYIDEYGVKHETKIVDD